MFGHVGIGDDGIGIADRAVFQADALGTALLDEDAVHLRIQVNFDVQFLQQSAKAVIMAPVPPGA